MGFMAWFPFPIVDGFAARPRSWCWRHSLLDQSHHEQEQGRANDRHDEQAAKPLPRIIMPASQPATAPMARKMTKLCLSTMLPPGGAPLPGYLRPTFSAADEVSMPGIR